ncbi:MAG: hypothetical protein KIT14_10375 [bacterium]|nr:hypothetical protein [bacterium]
MHRRGSLPIVLVACLLLAASAGTADAQTARRAAATTAKPAPTAAPSPEQRLLTQMADHQKWVGEQVWGIKEGVDAVPGLVADMKDQITANQEQITKAREEVKGLYVELSSLRQQLAQLRDDVASVNDNVSGFRTFAGFFIAAMLLLLVVIFAMVVRR